MDVEVTVAVLLPGTGSVAALTNAVALFGTELPAKTAAGSDSTNVNDAD